MALSPLPALRRARRPPRPERPPGPQPAAAAGPGVVARFGAGLRLLDPDDPSAYTTCFTAGYGRSLMHAGSYLRSRDRVRRFTPEEIARLLHFPPSYRFPTELPRRKRWQLIGNSLSVVAVREVLRAFPSVMPEGT